MIGFQPMAGGVGFPAAADDEGRKRQMMAQLLMNSGSQSTGGGPMDALNKVASGALAGYQMGMQPKPQAPPAGPASLLPPGVYK